MPDARVSLRFGRILAVPEVQRTGIPTGSVPGIDNSAQAVQFIAAAPVRSAGATCPTSLLEHGADPDLQRNENIAPVLVGVSSSIECMRLMLEVGANVNLASEHNGETALHAVVGGSDTAAVQLLFDRRS